MGVKLNYLIDVGLFISLVIVFVTGVIKMPELYSFWGVNHRYMLTASVTMVHDWSGLLFGFLAVLHFLLHIRWYLAATRSFLNKGGKENDGANAH